MLTHLFVDTRFVYAKADCQWLIAFQPGLFEDMFVFLSFLLCCHHNVWVTPSFMFALFLEAQYKKLIYHFFFMKDRASEVFDFFQLHWLNWAFCADEYNLILWIKIRK